MAGPGARGGGAGAAPQAAPRAAAGVGDRRAGQSPGMVALAQVFAERVTGRWWPVAFLGAAAAVGLCLIAARAPGFPLDDAWIHQDFARTLATTARFAYLPGHAGAGSTSPLWVVLLLPPQLLAHGAAVWLLTAWVAVLGVGTLGALSLLTGRAAADLARSMGAAPGVVALAGLLAGVATLTEWHLVWAAASGMETDLFAVLVLSLFLAADRGARPLGLGLLGGLAVATRPEGLAAIAVVIVAALWGTLRGRDRGMGGAEARWMGGAVTRPLARWGRVWLVPCAAGALMILVPYGALNLEAGGALLPSTLAAKAAYYGPHDLVVGVAVYAWQVVSVLLLTSPALVVLLSLSCSRWLYARAADGVRPDGVRPGGRPAVGGVGAPALAGRTAAGPLGARVVTRVPLRLTLWLWCAALVVGYAGRVTELLAHGRYLMPILPALLAIGAAGAAPLLVDTRRRALAVVGGMVFTGACVVSLGRGAQIYAENVHFINSIQVDTALWLRGHVPPRALVATHDIGAIGYFGGHPVLDMAGLADPAIVPYLGDQAGLERYLERRHAEYVVMFTDWFPPPATLAHDLGGRVLYRSRGNPTFVVYRTGW